MKSIAYPIHKTSSCPSRLRKYGNPNQLNSTQNKQIIINGKEVDFYVLEHKKFNELTKKSCNKAHLTHLPTLSIPA